MVSGNVCPAVLCVPYMLWVFLIWGWEFGFFVFACFWMFNGVRFSVGGVLGLFGWVGDALWFLVFLWLLGKFLKNRKIS